MALNSSHHDSGGLVVFLGENILCYHDGVEMEFGKTNNEIMSKVCPNALHSPLYSFSILSKLS